LWRTGWIIGGRRKKLPGTDSARNWGVTRQQGKLWTYDELLGLKKAVNAEGLELEAIENLDPAHWHDILLDGPRKRQQLEDVKTIIRTMGKVGIPILGYNFSIAGVWGTCRGPMRAAERIRWDSWAATGRKKRPFPTARCGT